MLEVMNNEHKMKYKLATVCYICLKPFEGNSKNWGKCAKHNHPKSRPACTTKRLAAFGTCLPRGEAAACL